MANEVTSFEVQGNEYDVNPHLTFDSTPTVGSSNPVTSNGIALAVQSAAIGTDISVGRTAGTPVGYCSIAYGENNTASGDYSIVFGKNNKSLSIGNIISGELNTSYDMYNAIFGMRNSNNGYASLVSGYGNIVGLKIQEITESSYPDYEHGDGLVYIGYVNPSTNKIYYDEQMTSEITIDRRYSSDEFYFVDKRTYNNQRPGDVYLYSRDVYQSGVVFTAKKLRPEYANFTNYCRSLTYCFKGACYFNAATDKIYSDAAMEHEITGSTLEAHNRPLYFDIVDGSFIFYRSNNPIVSAPKWNRVKVYKGLTGDKMSTKKTYWGIYAYINRRAGGNTAFHVYSSSDLDSSEDITDQLLDGEVVCDLASGKCYRYVFDTSHRLVYVVNTGDTFNNPNSYLSMIGSGSVVKDSAACLIVGNDHDMSGTFMQSSIVSGWGNVMRGSSGTQMTASIQGIHNLVSLNTGNIGMMHIIGGDNVFEVSQINFDGITGGSIIGEYNTLGGYGSDQSQIFGNNNSVKDSTRTSSIGNYNTINFASGSTIIGRENSVTKYTGALAGYNPTTSEVVDARWMPNGVLLINNEPYDLPINPSSTKNYPMNQLFRMIGRVRQTDNGYNSKHDPSIESVLGYCASTDGRTLFDIPKANWVTDNPVNIFGNYNDYIRNIQGFYGYSDDRLSYHNLIIGSYNKLYASGTSYVGLIGDHLVFYGNAGSAAKKNKGIIYMGSYNSDSNAEGYINVATPQLIVGIGTADDDRKNGFVVMKNGVLIAPECPNELSEATSKTYTDARKLVMTYGLVMDYVHNVSPGTTGKPGQVVVTLNSADWSNGEQTIDFSGVDDNSVVIINPSGSPDLFYTDRIYLKSQGDGELTFGCLFAPAENVDVKVVYWT